MITLKEFSNSLGFSAVHVRRITTRSPTAKSPPLSLDRLIKNWHSRHAAARLAELDEHLLRDVGLTRADVDWALELPLIMNATEALQDCASRNKL